MGWWQGRICVRCHKKIRWWQRTKGKGWLELHSECYRHRSGWDVWDELYMEKKMCPSCGNDNPETMTRMFDYLVCRLCNGKFASGCPYYEWLRSDGNWI